MPDIKTFRAEAKTGPKEKHPQKYQMEIRVKEKGAEEVLPLSLFFSLFPFSLDPLPLFSPTWKQR